MTGHWMSAVRFALSPSWPYDIDKDIRAVVVRGVMEQEELREARLQLIAWLRAALREALWEEEECSG